MRPPIDRLILLQHYQRDPNEHVIAYLKRCA